ncbi:hypothetical protein [Chitinophaga sp. RAB17]|uniref:hypothetical protein n=1 Tax=Chitinophaga sp. RAB17 TaxID=3233049 RepID=UPI003F914336
MENETTDQTSEDISLFQRLRNSILPIKPTDGVPVKILKEGGFYLFAVMILLISLTLGGAIMFVL